MTPEEAFVQYAAGLKNYLQPFGTREQVEDAVSETFLALTRDPSQLTNASPLSVLIRIARFRLADIRRSSAQREKRERACAKRELDNRVQPLALSDLPLSSISERDRTILRLRAEGFDHAEIGQRLNLKPKTVSRAQIRAIETLKGCVA